MEDGSFLLSLVCPPRTQFSILEHASVTAPGVRMAEDTTENGVIILGITITPEDHLGFFTAQSPP
jgi:hypothetical protein